MVKRMLSLRNDKEVENSPTYKDTVPSFEIEISSAVGPVNIIKQLKDTKLSTFDNGKKEKEMIKNDHKHFS